MSAIYGIINKTAAVAVEQGTKMQETLAHRAMNGAAFKYCNEALLGSCRLIIYPNQQYEQLPLETPDFLFTANVSLHNRETVINELDGDNGSYHVIPDAHLVFEAFKKWGKGCVNYLDGEFVFAVWDKNAKELFIASDHIGFKPLYYYDSPGQFIFCSEIKGIEAIKTTPNYFDETALYDACFKLGDPECTYNKEIKSLGGGNSLSLTRNGLVKEKYWVFGPKGKYNFNKDQDWYDCMKDVFVQAVEKRISTEVNVGITLSGGLDSSSVASILAQALKKKNMPLYAFSSTRSEDYNAANGENYIEIINRHCGNVIHSFVPAANESVTTGIDEAIFTDERIPNYFHFMDRAFLKAAKEKNIGLFYSGFGGDFWASAKGMQVIYEMIHKGQWIKAFSLIRDIASVENTSFYNVFKAEYLNYTSLVEAYVKLKGWNTKAIYRKEFLERHTGRKIKRGLFSMAASINIGKISRLTGMFDNRNETYGMAAATPFFDRQLMEFLADVPKHYFLHKGYRRSFFRHSMENILPPQIQWRLTKSPYITGHWDRFEKEPFPLAAYLKRNDPVFEKYFEPVEVQKVLSTMENASGERKRMLSFRLYLVVVAVISLEHLKKLKYYFP